MYLDLLLKYITNHSCDFYCVKLASVFIVNILFRTYDIMVKDIMKHHLFFVAYGSSYADLKSLLHKSDLRSFPVVDSPRKAIQGQHLIHLCPRVPCLVESMILLGSVQRRNLQQMLCEHRDRWLEKQETTDTDMAVVTPDR